MEEFYDSCWQAAEKELIKAQRTIVDPRGLSGSLYFELLKKPGVLEGDNQKAFNQNKADNYEKQPKDLIYDTFKKMALSAREEFRAQELISLDVT